VNQSIDLNENGTNDGGNIIKFFQFPAVRNNNTGGTRLFWTWGYEMMCVNRSKINKQVDMAVSMCL
jgi:hypothetical protein